MDIFRHRIFNRIGQRNEFHKCEFFCLSHIGHTNCNLQQCLRQQPGKHIKYYSYNKPDSNNNICTNDLQRNQYYPDIRRRNILHLGSRRKRRQRRSRMLVIMRDRSNQPDSDRKRNSNLYTDSNQCRMYGNGKLNCNSESKPFSPEFRHRHSRADINSMDMECSRRGDKLSMEHYKYLSGSRN